VVKRKYVGASGNLDDDRIIRSVRAVILGELYAKPPSLNAHHRIELRVEVCRSSKDLSRNLIFLDGRSRMVEHMLRKVAEQLAKGLRPVQDVAVHQLVDLPEILLSFRHADPSDNRLKRV
jgi:hypothetical protein